MGFKKGERDMNKKSSYGKFDKFLHWFMALNIFATLIFSKGMSTLPDEQKLVEYGDHGLSVTTIAICLLIRIFWRAREGFPSLPATMSELQKFLAKLVHYGLYSVFIAQICIGVFLASTTKQDFIAKGYNINYSSFNLVSDSLYDNLIFAHITGYWIIVVLLVAHIGAAIKHHLIDKDGVLTRMLPFTRAKEDS
ncbi:MAG: cytochrome b [Halioglobus sp.]